MISPHPVPFPGAVRKGNDPVFTRCFAINSWSLVAGMLSPDTPFPPFMAVAFSAGTWPPVEDYIPQTALPLRDGRVQSSEPGPVNGG